MRRIRPPLAALLLALGSCLSISSPASANDSYLVLNTVALHFKNADERNQLNPGIGWEFSPSNSVGFHIGTLVDSFGYQARYGGINYATPRFAANRLRLLLGATILHKQFHKNSEPETKLLPLPAVELALTPRAVLNISGSPEVDFADQHNNAVVFFQLKLNLL